MTILTENNNSFFFSSPAILVESDRDLASDWASSHIVSNPALKWIVGKYVEADSANSNGQYWSLADLRLKQPTIQHSPMNIGHRPNDIVGTFVASEMIYPTQVDQNPYIETVGAIWKYYFPEEVALVEQAYKTGELFLSMECISDSITCVGPNGCGETFAYLGPMSLSYCEHIRDRTGFRQLDNPHFLAGALIAPPDRPGWKNASVNEMSTLFEKHSDEATKVYAELNSESHLSESKKEQLVFQLLSIGEDANSSHRWSNAMNKVMEFAKNNDEKISADITIEDLLK